MKQNKREEKEHNIEAISCIRLMLRYRLVVGSCIEGEKTRKAV